MFVKPQDPILRKVAKEIPKDQINSFEIKKIVESMLTLAYGEQREKLKPIMVGLAAVQIGISKRIILVDTKADGKGRVGDLKVFINPEIIWKSKKEGEWYEGCYSTGKICGIVSRPTSIKIKSFVLQPSGPSALRLRLEELQAKSIIKKYDGYVARIFQHEIDHLDGKLFIDHIKNPDKLHWVLKREFPLYRNRMAWKNWPKKYPLPLGS